MQRGEVPPLSQLIHKHARDWKLDLSWNIP